jgi:tetratricopeptide (TPR) repeat protein
MRNTSFKLVLLNLFLAAALVGCQSSKPTAQQTSELASAEHAVNQNQADLAIQKADDYLRQQPDGPGDAEALYLKGRGYEQKTAATAAESAKNLAAARAAYEDALNLNPSPKTEGYVRASLSNVAFFQEDYPAAVREASRAFILITTPAIRAQLLYRIGVSQQRTERFTDADQTFGLIVTDYPGSPIAQSAQQHIGLRVFYVQVGTFDSAGADHATASLRNNQLPASRQNTGGQTLVSAGPFNDYGSAKAAKLKLIDQFPQSQIVP